MIFRILRTIRFLNDAEIQATRTAIESDTGTQCRTVLAKMTSEGLIFKHIGEYWLTEDGSTLLDSAYDHPHYSESSRFDDEALTGIDNLGRETTIINPVLSTGHSPRMPDTDGWSARFVDSSCDYQEIYDTIGRRYEYSPDKISMLISDNLIAFCDACYNWGVFRRILKTGTLRRKCTICEGRRRDATRE